MGDELLYLYDIHVTQTKFLDKLHNVLVLLNGPKKESGIIIIFKDASDVALPRRLIYTEIAVVKSVTFSLV